MKKNYSVKVDQKKRKIVVSNYALGKKIEISGLRAFEVAFYQCGHYSDISWCCHCRTYQIANVISQIFGKNQGFLEITQEDGEWLIATLLNTLETLGHEVIYE